MGRDHKNYYSMGISKVFKSRWDRHENEQEKEKEKEAKKKAQEALYTIRGMVKAKSKWDMQIQNSMH